MVHSPNDDATTTQSFRSKLTKGQGRWAKMSENPENPEKLSPGRGVGGGYWGGRPLWDISAYLCQHRQDVAETFMVDNPSDPIQTHKVSGEKSLRGRVGGPNRSRARATCGPLEPCVRNQRTTGAVRVRPGEH